MVLMILKAGGVLYWWFCQLAGYCLFVVLLSQTYGAGLINKTAGTQPPCRFRNRSGTNLVLGRYFEQVTVTE